MTTSNISSRIRALPLLSVASLGLTLLFAPGCGTEADELDDEFRIINGAPAPSSIPEYAATIGVHQRSGDQVSIDPFCSGTLIADDVVLTAAHCCDEAWSGQNFNPMEPEEVAVYFGDGPAFQGNSLNGEFFAVSEVQIHPNYSRTSLQNDICLLRLSVPNVNTTPIPALPSAIGITNNDAGTLLDHVGFGYSDLAKTQYGVKLQAEVPLAGVGCVVSGCPNAGTEGMISYEQDGNPYFGPCNGDSGGPAFIDRGGQTYVAGITSYGDANCSVYGVSTNVSFYQSWIDAFVGGGDGGGSEPPPAGCDNDGVCETGESCDGRNGTFACGDCPGKTTGRWNKRFCYVGGTCEGPGCP